MGDIQDDLAFDSLGRAHGHLPEQERAPVVPDEGGFLEAQRMQQPFDVCYQRLDTVGRAISRHRGEAVAALIRRNSAVAGGRERRQRVDDLLDEVGLGERSDERIGGYSGGMRQRVAVARTLLRLPPVIIVDEPTAGLDPEERLRFYGLLGELARDRIVLLSTHIVEDVAVLCPSFVVIQAGRLVADTTPAGAIQAIRGTIITLGKFAGSLADQAQEFDLKPWEYNTQQRDFKNGYSYGMRW